MALRRLLGDDLVTSSSDPVPVDDLLPGDEPGILGVYVMSAAPQCADFSQKLIEFWKTREGERFTIVSLSLEDDEEHFKNSIQGLPWPVIQRTARHRKARVLRRLRLVSAAPALALLEFPSGRLLTSSARERLLETPHTFPWRPRPLADTLADVALRTADGSATVEYEKLTQHIKGFYFAANWCPPCKSFSPHLVETYQVLKDRGHHFEVIFVSSDRSEASFESSICGCPWLAVPWSEDEVRRELAASLGVQGIPALVLVDTQGRVITHEGRAELAEDPQAKQFPWPARRVHYLSERTAISLQDGPALVLLVESEEELTAAEDILRPAAQELWAREEALDASHNHDDSLRFFVGCDGETADALREFGCLDEDAVPLLALLDVTARRVATLEDADELTPDSVSCFARSFLSGQLTCTEIPGASAPCSVVTTNSMPPAPSSAAHC